MEKPAPTQVPIHDLLTRRWSPHAFDSRPVPPEILRRLFEAARWAPSSFNAQPWAFLVATREQPAEFEKMLDCLAEGNRPWAKTAPVLMITVAESEFAHNGKPNRHAFYDVGAAMANLTLEATSEGIFVHQMAGFDAQKAREIYAIPPTHEAVSAVALGYPGEVSSLPDALQQRTLAPRSRKTTEQFVFAGKWGESAPAVK